MRKLARRARFEVLQSVVWAEESKTGLWFEIGPSYGDVPMTSHCATVWKFICSPGVRGMTLYVDARAKPWRGQAQGLHRPSSCLAVLSKQRTFRTPFTEFPPRWTFLEGRQAGNQTHDFHSGISGTYHCATWRGFLVKCQFERDCSHSEFVPSFVRPSEVQQSNYFLSADNFVEQITAV